MELTIAPRGILQIDDARIIWKNFAGRPDKYNREGDRNFALVIPNHEIADKLIEEGWNVKVRPPRDEDEESFMFLKVNVKFNDRGPNVYLESNGNKVRLDEESIACLDSAFLTRVDLDIRPYDWEVNGKTGRAAYLQAMRAIQEVDRFASDDRFDEEDDLELPFDM